MAKHRMTLYSKPFKSIVSGHKKVEIRLNDEKRRILQIGDLIEFEKLPERIEKVKVKVKDLIVYGTFKEMFAAIPFEDFDCAGWSMEEMLEGMYSIYTRAQEAEWGTLAIRIQKLDEQVEK
ncbi:ASCH domain-containing protein [Bacillus horti]|uniref:ASC-1-like (ASCH) protein n=1 Tax=Caldalkalibacillus horti TaxID=77523 RepID=A0ABT9W546_9BACI|nr:ASCH domain-containing protein [Bacillus horti]MDQ0168361.1 ASC-1-like (ASCH) protein [Bacillus horti]